MTADRAAPDSWRDDEAYARQLDVSDPLASYRNQFHIPMGVDGRELVYFAGNSLGLQPRATRELINQELDDWATLAVEAHFHGKTPWYSYHEVFREVGARLVGALPGEVVMMNSLTVNLHLLMASFYRPTPQRFKILIEDAAFPSDTYAVRSQLIHHGFDPDTGLIVAKPRTGEHTIRTEDIQSLLGAEGERIALVMMSGVNYYSGQALDMARLTAAAQAKGCTVGWDLAHAAGNLVLKLHDWNVDFAAWCSYKYLNSGPGAVAGVFVHERHGNNPDIPRFAGWWGNDPATRFRMHLEPRFIPRAGADGWQVSNPPIFSLAPLRAALALFDQATMPALRSKSVRMTAYLLWLLDRAGGGAWQIITPRDIEQRGCQLSLLVNDRPRERFSALQRAGVICDFREPNVIRVAPVPLYNTFHDVWRFARVLGDLPKSS